MNQVYSPVHKFAGDRVWSAAPGQEIWAKPLTENRVGVVIFNRNGTTEKCSNYAADFGDAGSLDCPCDDNVTSPEYAGAQTITLDFRVLPLAWLLGTGTATATDRGKEAIACNVRDIFAGSTGKVAKDLGSFTRTFVAENLGPHASRFLLLSNCTDGIAGMQR